MFLARGQFRGLSGKERLIVPYHQSILVSRGQNKERKRKVFPQISVLATFEREFVLSPRAVSPKALADF